MSRYNICVGCTTCRYFNSDDDNCCPGGNKVCFEYSSTAKTHTAWVMMSADSDVITEEYDTPEEAVNELKEKYTVQQMHEAGITCNKLLCDAKSWLECLEEVAY